MKERKEIEEKFQWNLTDLFKSDADCEQAMKDIETEVKAAVAFKGQLKDAASIRAYYDASTELFRKLENFATYASLRHSEDTRSSEAQALLSKAMAKYVESAEAVSFANSEILALPEEELKKIVESPELAPHKFSLQQLIDEKLHILSAEAESILAQLGEVITGSKAAANTLMDADLKFDSAQDSKGEDHELSGATFISLEMSDDRTLRQNAFKNFYKGYSDHNNTFATTYSGIVKSWVANAKIRHYESSRDMSMSEEHIPAAVYDSLIESVHKHMPAMYKYVELRKKILGLDELHYYDVYTPLVGGDDHKYTYEQCQDMVLEAVKPLGENYVNTVKEAFSDRWIDVYPNNGKAGGAFSSGTYDSRPYILTSYTDDYESVSTVAHEMGHSLHTWHSKKQPVQYADYTLFVAEVASTVNENLLVESLLAKTEDPKERLFLLNQYMEGFKGTIYRQTMFAEFEKKAHAMYEAGEALTAEALNNLYEELIKQYFGPDLVIDPEVKYEWSRIPHFYRPFYVYKYATSYSAAVAISENILKNGDAAVKPYLEFLSMGGSAYPLDELKVAGVDMTTPAPINAALEKFDKILDEAYKCYEQIK